MWAPLTVVDKEVRMRCARFLVVVLWLVAAGCGDDLAGGGSGGTAGSDGNAGSGGPGGSAAVDAPFDSAMRSDGFMPTDAALNDGGAFTTIVTPDSVRCLDNGAQTTCTTPTQECCTTVMDASITIECTSVAQCPSNARLSLTCDGPEDCPGTELCCFVLGPPITSKCTAI